VSGIDPPRYEPLPGLAALPAWLWRRAGRGARIGAGLLLLALIGFAIALVPSLRDSERDRAAATARQRAEQRAELVRRLEAEQRPRVHQGTAAPDSLPARARLMDAMTATITADARSRGDRGVERTDCERYPRSVDGKGADQRLSQRRGRYLCVAVTAEFSGGVIGEQYRALVDFETGRYAFCKVISKTGPTRDTLVTTPRACGG
jgi:hypothetical protein